MSKWDTCATGHPDLYIPFFQIGFELLRAQGILGYITVNSFTKSLNGRGIRNYFHEKQVELKIIDFEDEQIFNSRMTYTAICFLSNNQSLYLFFFFRRLIHFCSIHLSYLFYLSLCYYCIPLWLFYSNSHEKTNKR